MFSDYKTQVTGFSSVSHSKSDVSETTTQTLEQHVEEKEIQAFEKKDADTQTQVTAASQSVAYDEDKLAAFLARVAPLLQEELDFQVDLSDLDTEDANEESNLTRVAVYPSKDTERKVSCLSWNSTGGTLAVGFGVIRHDSWCNHDSRVEMYSTSMSVRRVTAPKIYHVASCVTCLVFHPSEPSVVLAGLYNGEVLVWDLRKEDWSAEGSTSEDKNCVVHGGWCDESTFYSATTGGTILLRKVSYTNRTISTPEKFLITRGTINPKLKSPSEGMEIMTGGQLNSSNFVVGAGGGYLIQCSLSPLQPMSAKPDYKDPVVHLYESHKAVITAVKTGWGEQTFLTAATDGQIRVYKVMQAEPKFVINTKECLLDVFQTSTSGIFGFVGSEQKIGFVKATGQILDSTLDLTGKTDAVVAQTALRRELVAIGDAVGNVEVWRISISKRTG